MKTMIKSSSVPDLARMVIPKTNSTPDLTLSRRRLSLIIPGGISIIKKFVQDTTTTVIHDSVEKSCEQMISYWIRIKDSLHLLETDTDVLSRCKIRNALTFYEAIINDKITCNVLDQIFTLYEQIHVEGFEDLSKQMKEDLQYRRQMK